MACSTCASAKWPIRHLAMTGTDTAAMMPSIMSGSLILATPPCTRMSAGTRSSAITAMPRLTRAVPVPGWGLTVDTREPRLINRDYLRPSYDQLRETGPGGGLAAQRGAALLGDERVVHLEELGRAGLAGQAQQAGERPPPGLPGRRDHVVVELAGQEHLVRGRLDLGEELVGPLLAAQRGPEAGLAERGAQRPGQVALGQVARAVAAAGAVHRGGQQQARGRVEQPGGGQLHGHRTTPQQGHVQGGAGHLDPGVHAVDPARAPGHVYPHQQCGRHHDDDVGDHARPSWGKSLPDAVTATWVLPRTTVS